MTQYCMETVLDGSHRKSQGSTSELLFSGGGKVNEMYI